jgi:ribosomal protein S12 methylthiotransferase accessory factor
VWVPASLVYPSSPTLYDWSTNGLASGNHVAEATLHGLYEVIERDTISRLTTNGRLDLEARCRFVNVATVTGPVAALCDAIRRAELKLVLIAVQGVVPVATFWAVLLDRDPPSWPSRVRVGYGSHLSPAVAATRAITEAAQSRLTFIHGAREDLITKNSYSAADPSRGLYRLFDRIDGTTPWTAFDDDASDDLFADYARVLSLLQAAGFGDVYRVELTRAPFHIPVVSVHVCGMACNLQLF